MNDAERLEMRLRNREAAKRFTEEAFARKWIGRMEELVRMQIARVKA
jgi:alpha-1,2-mannosyltransferase